MDKYLTGTGVLQNASGMFHMKVVDPGRGKHYWNFVAMYSIKDPGSAISPDGPGVQLDMENLITIEGPGCLKCEKVYTPGLELKWCPGVMPSVWETRS